MDVRAWFIDSPTTQVPMDDVKKLGVVHWKLDADNWEKEGKLDQICKERGYTYRDFVDSKNIPNLDQKLKTFNEEHLHTDEEIRFFLGGSGYFDIRDGRKADDPWIRIHCGKGDMIVLPAGIYHRFVPDEKMHFHVMRLFVGEPVWTPYNREQKDTDGLPARGDYVKRFIESHA
eukprot:TRINITY_DN2192_c0_g1_i1.p1 TRINITY_DN2192_c0_g1~~TRINITY_DN2192_c0_g1_i1.p1  ORF type:complete len:186 (-),score=28.94 TRINITY_DN2192_c0_g1_i1:46-567(-)